MRLLRTDTYEVVKVGRTPPYAILSHRWEYEEITFEDINPRALQDDTLSSFSTQLRASAKKIRGACAVARQQGFHYIWIDTCCIDKSSSEELRMALNSMFEWYREAAVCYTYFNDVIFSECGPNMFNSFREDRHGQPSEWFKRGWTLQELIAPRNMEFYDAHWTPMGTRNDLAALVGKVAAIRSEYLNEKQDFRNASVATKMSWMAGRKTSVVEDVAYSLLGIFDIHLAPQYGEGIRAFSRLQDEIMLTYGTFDESLFAWQWPPNHELNCFRKDHSPPPKFAESKWGLLAPSPDCFKHSAGLVIDPRKVKRRINGGFHKTSEGITFTAGYGEGKNIFGLNKSSISLALNCWRVTSGGSLETVVLELSGGSRKGWSRLQCDTLRSSNRARVNSNRVMGFNQGAGGHNTVTVQQPLLRIQ